MADAPTVYLVTTVSSRRPEPVPTVLLSHSIISQGLNVLRQASPTCYLASGPNTPGENNLNEEPGQRRSYRGVPVVSDELRPALLVSYFYADKFFQEQANYRYRTWVLDSGAFSAWNSGQAIDLERYTATCAEKLATDATLTEVFALDVIGDWRASLKNAEFMWSRGVPATPTFHFGEPWDLLAGLCRDYPKVAVGGLVGKAAPVKFDFCGQVFARAWPKALHAFGVGQRKLVLAFPWHSVDAANWELGPCKFGQWRAFSSTTRHKGGKLSWRGSKQDLRLEIKHYLDLERDARARWGPTLAPVVAALEDSPWGWRRTSRPEATP